MYKLALVLTSLLTGCATTKRQLYFYPNLGFMIIKDSVEKTNKYCDGVTVWDDGTERKSGEPVLACTQFGGRIIRLQNTDKGCRALVHELAHIDGSYTDKEVEDKFEWDD